MQLCFIFITVKKNLLEVTGSKTWCETCSELIKLVLSAEWALVTVDAT